MITKSGVLRHMVRAIVTPSSFVGGYGMNVYLKYQTQIPTGARQVVKDMQEKANWKENGSSQRAEIQLQPINYSAGIKVQCLPYLVIFQEQLEIQILCEVL